MKKRAAWMRSLSASAPRVAVRTHLPWPLRAAAMAIALLLAAGVGFYLARSSSASKEPAPDTAAELDRVRTMLRQTTVERDRNAAAAAQWENQLKIDRAAHEQMGAQLKLLEEDNARLREDLSFFESLLPTPVAAKGVVIRSFRLQPEPEGDLVRYRLLVQQSGKPDKDFVGTVSLKVSLQQGGRPWILELPDTKAPDSGPPSLSFRHYQRVEGTFSLPPGAVVRSVQVSIGANGQVQAQQTFAM